MAIKWSPLAVSEAMEKVEAQVNLAEAFIQEAHRLAKEALAIPNLPQYMGGHLYNVERVTGGAVASMRGAIATTHRDLPGKDLAKEKAKSAHGTQPSLMDD